MNASLDNVQGAASAGVTTLTVAITVAAGSVLYGLVGDLGDSATCSGVTFDGVAMTSLLATTDDSSSGVLMKAGVWATVTPTTGSSKNMVATYTSATPGGCALHAVAVANANSTSVAASHGTIYHAGDAGAGAGADLTVSDSAAGDFVLAVTSSVATTPTANQTALRSDLDVAGGSGDFVSEYAIAAGTGQVMSFTNDQFCTNVAFAIRVSAVVISTVIPVFGARIATQQRMG